MQRNTELENKLHFEKSIKYVDCTIDIYVRYTWILTNPMRPNGDYKIERIFNTTKKSDSQICRVLGYSVSRFR